MSRTFRMLQILILVICRTMDADSCQNSTCQRDGERESQGAWCHETEARCSEANFAAISSATALASPGRLRVEL